MKQILLLWGGKRSCEHNPWDSNFAFNANQHPTLPLIHLRPRAFVIVDTPAPFFLSNYFVIYFFF